MMIACRAVVQSETPVDSTESRLACATMHRMEADEQGLPGGTKKDPPQSDIPLFARDAATYGMQSMMPSVLFLRLLPKGQGKLSCQEQERWWGSLNESVQVLWSIGTRALLELRCCVQEL